MRGPDWKGSFLSTSDISNGNRDRERNTLTEISLSSCEGSEEVGTATAEALRMGNLFLTRAFGVLLANTTLNCGEEYREAIAVARKGFPALKAVQIFEVSQVACSRSPGLAGLKR